MRRRSCCCWSVEGDPSPRPSPLGGRTGIVQPSAPGERAPPPSAGGGFRPWPDPFERRRSFLCISLRRSRGSRTKNPSAHSITMQLMPEIPSDRETSRSSKAARHAGSAGFQPARGRSPREGAGWKPALPARSWSLVLLPLWCQARRGALWETPHPDPLPWGDGPGLFRHLRQGRGRPHPLQSGQA